MSAVTADLILDTPTLSVRDIACDGACRHRSPSECAGATAIVFPYRGLFLRHLGRDEALGEANQALFFNQDEEYAISHPLAGGDACLSLAVDEAALRELVSRERLLPGATLAFRKQRMRIDPVAQGLAARLRLGLRARTIDGFEAETLALALVRRAVGEGRATPDRVSQGRRKLVDRAKIALAIDPARRWTLAEIGAELRCSPVYLTQLFQQVEGVPLYRYQMRLRLACALDRIAEQEDLTGLALDLGFSSHSHFSAAFRSVHGQSPSAFRQSVLQSRRRSARRAP